MELDGYDLWKTTDQAETDPYLAGDVFEEEDRRARDWADLIGNARDFAQRYGQAAMVRCISEALR